MFSGVGPAQPKWTNVDNWRLRLEPYMAMHQVRLLPGEPIDREEPENLLSKYFCAVGTITLTIAAVVFLKKRYLLPVNTPILRRTASRSIHR